ncbi:MAG: hypothetical protein NT004_07145 [Bacteroidetes bacterium]|nr:hypothetical protein [Bacteroidota bacterium]
MKTEPKFNEQELTDMALSYPLETEEPESDCQRITSVIGVLCFLAWDFNLMEWLKSLPWDFIAVVILPNIIFLLLYPVLKRWNE